ncbi:MAG TPA: S8 family serine peptidase, partial [Pyrinomonadaceae bacterium]|nr:S8 family serine peptidase [Pyrinomonadaceae bacterium]
NYIVQPTATPNDPQFTQQWALQNTGQNVQGIAGTPGADIKATAAWDVDTNRGSTANVVGIVDTGIDYNHPDLAANVWSAPAAFTVNIRGVAINCAAGTHGFNALTSTCDPLDDDAGSHGTHIAGIVGAVGNNSAGVSGVNWNASLMGLKFISPSGGDIAHAIDAISFAIQAKSAFAATAGANVRVLNNSWGPADSVGQGGFSQELLNTINEANDNQMLFVASAGNLSSNNDTTPYYPASYAAPPNNAANVISVAATNQSDALAGFSNYGATSVDVAAPGVSILSTTHNNTYGYLSGTSQAAAFTSGAAALVLARCSALDTSTLKSTLLTNADALASLNGKTKGSQANTGRRLNVNAALSACAAAYPPSVTRSLSTVADAYVNKALATTNFGNATELQVKQTSAGDDSHDRYTYLRFDLSSVSGQINQATLRLFGSLTNASIGSTPISVQQAATTAWIEGDGGTDNNPAGEITFSNQPG